MSFRETLGFLVSAQATKLWSASTNRPAPVFHFLGCSGVLSTDCMNDKPMRSLKHVAVIDSGFGLWLAAMTFFWLWWLQPVYPICISVRFDVVGHCVDHCHPGLFHGDLLHGADVSSAIGGNRAEPELR